MLSHDHNYIFSHIPKCAGTTIEEVLYKYSSESTGTRLARKHKWWRNKLLFDLFNRYPDYYKFTFVRNPWSRTVSCFTFFKKRNWIPQKITFSDYLDELSKFLNANNSPETKYRLANHNRCFPDDLPQQLIYKNFMAGYHALPQTYFITKDFDYIGRVENLQQDFNKICDKIGIPQQQLPCINKSNHKHYTEYYDDGTKQIVAKIYTDDIEYFGYKFGE